MKRFSRKATRPSALLVTFIALLFFSLSPVHAASQSQYANGWSVNHIADWNPFPPDPAPLGPPNAVCIGTSTPPGSWAQFTFPAFSIPAGDLVTGIELNLKYISQSGSHTLQLTDSGSLIGIPQTIPLVPGVSFCDNTVPTHVGGNGMLWGSSLSAADFNAGNVGFRITQNANTITMDSVELIVYHDSGATPEADLAISKTDGLSVVNQGGTLVYTVVVSNNGPDDAVGATVSDNFPAGLDCDWTCSASAGSSCGAGPSVGDISDSADLADGGNATYSATCDVDPGASGTLLNTATVAPPAGTDDPNPANNSASDSTDVNQAPVALCGSVAVNADPLSCDADASVDSGSYDPDGDTMSLSQSPASPYLLGDTPVTLTAVDGGGLADSCSATVSVIDVTAPSVQCNSPGSIVPPDTPVAFSASGSDSCGAVTTRIVSYDCYKFTKKGKRIDKTGSCVVSLSGDTLTVEDSGGVGTTIEWTAIVSDGSGNNSVASCSVDVVNPGKN